MGRQAKLKLQATPQQYSLLDTAGAVVCSTCSTWHSILSAPTRIQNAVSALQICVCNALQAALTGFILCRNIPAMPMTCSQVKHKSSGFLFLACKKICASVLRALVRLEVAVMRNFTKPVIDVEQQVAVLKQRGLSIQNEAKAKLFLQSVSFFRLSAYMRPYQINHDPEHRFKPEASFKQITQTYEFDRKLRLLVMAAIERVEVSVRAVMSNYLGPKYNNAHWYLDRKLFKRHFAYERLLQTIERKQSDALQSYQRESQRIDKARDKSAQDKEILKARRAKESYARHYPLTYSEPDLMPGWAMLEELTLGDLSHLYAGLGKDVDKKAIARMLGLSMPLLESWLKTLTTIRNICAHHSRLWNRELGIKPELPKDSSIKWPDYQQHAHDNTRVAVIVSVLQHFMLQISPHDDWKNDLMMLLNTYTEIDQAMMGFPAGWQHDPFWSVAI